MRGLPPEHRETMNLAAFRSLRFRLATLILLTMAMVTGLLVVSYIHERSSILDHMSEDFTRVVTLIADDQEQLITRTRQFLMVLARIPEIETVNPSACSDLLGRLMDEYSRYTSIGMLDPEGRPLCKAGRGLREGGGAHEPWFLHTVRSRDFAMGPLQDETEGTNGFAISYPSLGERGEVRAVLYASMDLGHLDELLARLHPPRHGVLMMISRGGALLSCLPSSGHCAETRQAMGSLVDTFARKGTGALEFGEPGNRSLCAFAPLSSAVDTGFFVALTVPVSSLYARANRVIAYQFAGVWLLAVLALCSVWVGSSAFIIGPLKAMGRTARRLSEGDLNARTGLPHQRGELGSLARALDEMAEALESRDRQVQEYERGLRSMASRLTRAEERERRRIAEGLHDRVGQLLGLSKIKLGILLQSGLSQEIAELGGEIRHLVAQALQETRSLTFEISPPLLYEIGLEAALEYLAERTHERHGLCVVCSDDGEPKPVDEDARVLLYRAAHELLANVVKHANAQSVRIRTESREGRVVLTVADDGMGFDPEAETAPRRSRDGYGLFSLRERIRHAGGSFTIDSSPGRGCRVVLSLPVNEEPQGSAWASGSPPDIL